MTWNIANEFSEVSTARLVQGCVGYINGFLAIIKRPTMKDCSGQPTSYYSSGHYGVQGLNMQAVCDAKCRFQFFGVVAPGKCVNEVAFERTPLFQYAQQLPDGFALNNSQCCIFGWGKDADNIHWRSRRCPLKGCKQFFLQSIENPYRNAIWYAHKQVAYHARSLADYAYTPTV
jgi:hypothetical protein